MVLLFVGVLFFHGGRGTEATLFVLSYVAFDSKKFSDIELSGNLATCCENCFASEVCSNAFYEFWTSAKARFPLPFWVPDFSLVSTSLTNAGGETFSISVFLESSPAFPASSPHSPFALVVCSFLPFFSSPFSGLTPGSYAKGGGRKKE